MVCVPSALCFISIKSLLKKINEWILNSLRLKGLRTNNGNDSKLQPRKQLSRRKARGKNVELTTIYKGIQKAITRPKHIFLSGGLD